MDAAGVGFAVVAEARTIATSITNRVNNFRRAPQEFKAVSESLTRLKLNIDEVEKLTRNFPRAIPPEVTVLFNSALNSVCGSLRDANENVGEGRLQSFCGK